MKSRIVLENQNPNEFARCSNGIFWIKYDRVIGCESLQGAFYPKEGCSKRGSLNSFAVLFQWPQSRNNLTIFKWNSAVPHDVCSSDKMQTKTQARPHPSKWQRGWALWIRPLNNVLTIIKRIVNKPVTTSYSFLLCAIPGSTAHNLMFPRIWILHPLYHKIASKVNNRE